MSSALVDRFVQHVKRLQFVEAEKLLRAEWGDAVVTASTASASFLAVLQQLAGAESQYFNFAYLTSKFFRKENNLRDIYTQMRAELGKIIAEDNQQRGRLIMGKKEEEEENRDGMDNANGGTFPDAKIVGKFAIFADIRANLVEFYSLLPGKEWRAFESDQFRHLMSPLDQPRLLSKNDVDVDDDGLLVHCRRELVVLQLFRNAQLALQQCDLLDALVLLGRTRAMLDEWFRSLDASQQRHHLQHQSSATSAARPPTATAAKSSAASAASSASAFLLATLGLRRRPSFCRLGLLQFLLQFHQLLVAKFSLYFHDTLVAHAPHGEMRSAFSAPNSFLQLFQTFARKANTHTICLLINRIDQNCPFQGFGYHFDDSVPETATPSTTTTPRGDNGKSPGRKRAVDHGPTTTDQQRAMGSPEKFLQFKSGLADKYPALLFLPPERRCATIAGPPTGALISAGGGGAGASHTAGLSAGGPVHARGSEYATICAFVQEGCCGLSGGIDATVGAMGGGGIFGGSSSTDRLTESGKIRYLYDKNKEQTFFTACVEANIHLVVTFERRVQERESTVHTFFNDALNGLRGTKLFQQEIKTFGK